jgi:hypothetical protein
MKIVIKNRKIYKVVFILFIALVIVRLIALLLSIIKTHNHTPVNNSVSYSDKLKKPSFVEGFLLF